MQIVGLAQARARTLSSPPDVPAQASGGARPRLLNADSNPTLRYPVSVMESTVSCGWLDVTKTGVSYTVVKSGTQGRAVHTRKFAPGEVHYLVAPAYDVGSEGFDVSLGEVNNLMFVKNLLQFTFAKRTLLLIYLPQEQWGAVEKPRQFEEAGQLNQAGTMAIQRTLQNFDRVLAEARPPTPAALEVTLNAEPPTVEKGRPVALVWTSSNATSLDIEPGVGRVAAAGGISVVPQDSTNYILTANGPAGTKTASVFVTVTQPAPAAIPTIVLIEPSATRDGQTVEVSSSPLTINGVVMDTTGIPAVAVNGRPVTMRPTSAQAAQFRSDPLDLQPGDNRFEVSAVNSAHGQAKLAFNAHFTAAPPKAQPAPLTNSKGLGKAEILSLLKGDVPSARVADLVKERGVKFVPTPDDLKEIRGAGGGDDLIGAINQALAPPSH